MESAIESILHGYTTAALWSSNDDSGNPLDDAYSTDDIAPTTLEAMRADCQRFYDDNRALCDAALEAYGIPARAQGFAPGDLLGHDLWLTRCGHGVGFWDRVYLGGLGQRLTALVGHGTSFPPVELYVGDDGKVHQ